jgi:hypothetical protein
MCWFVPVVIGLAIATATAIVGGWSRTKPHLFWPLLVASTAWGFAAIYEVWFECIYDPHAKFDIRLDLLVIAIGLITTTVVCVGWSAVSLLIDWHRSRNPRSIGR